MSIGDRLARLLFIVPYVAHRDGVPLSELAEKLGVKPAQIEVELDLLSMVGQPPLTPDHLIDIYVEDDVVYVELEQSLSRPLRLTHDEARAMVLAASMVGQLGGIGKEVDAVIERILQLLTPKEAEIVRSLSQRIGLWEDVPHQPLNALREAISAREEVEIDYYSASSDRQKRYRVRPLAMISHTGVEYLVALDLDSKAQEKLFRVDRLAEVVRTQNRFDPPDTIDLEKYRTRSIYHGADDMTAEVRFNSSVAARVRESFADRQVEELSDGSVNVRMSTSSPAWLARWVLPFGTDAEVTSPPKFREHLGQLCKEAAQAYARDVD